MARREKLDSVGCKPFSIWEETMSCRHFTCLARRGSGAAVAFAGAAVALAALSVPATAGASPAPWTLRRPGAESRGGQRAARRLGERRRHRLGGR